jgi:hypothetical protein
MDVELPVTIERRTDHATCGPTSLRAIHRYWDDPIDLPTVIEETPRLPGGGTLAVHLSVHAPRRGHEADTWPCNTRHFDPTWFQPPTDALTRLQARAAANGLTDDARMGPALASMAEYLARGGGVPRSDLSPGLLAHVLGEGTPLVTGADGTDLDQCSRETGAGPDDVAGEPFGHFIVLGGHRSDDPSVAICDPLMDNPAHGTKHYRAGVDRLFGAMVLGIGSDGGNLLRVRPRDWQERRAGRRP